jgi:preprotein translocase subunit Sec63
MVADVAKAAAAIAFLSVIAANFMSSRTGQLDKERLAQVSLAVSKRQPVEPLTTGSITKVANETRLDPCALPR